MKTSAEFRRDIVANPFAWPGGYERFAITDDGGVLCYQCCESEAEAIDYAYRGDGWNIDALDCTANVDYWLICDHCSREIVEAYESEETI